MIKTGFLLLLFFCCGCLVAQDVGFERSTEGFVLDYLQLAGSQSALYYGKEQEGHRRTVNHPYYRDDRPANARLSHNQTIYPDVLLRLDMNRDELIVFSPDNRNIVLFPENVDFAEMYGRHIVYFRGDSLPGSPPTGYYMLLHSQKCKVLMRQTATLATNNTAYLGIDYHFIFSINYYLLKDGVYHNIRNKRGLLKLLEPHRRELSRFISSNKLRFRSNREVFITQTVKEYERLVDMQ